MNDSPTIPMSPARGQIIGQAVRDYGTRLFRFIRGRVRSDEDAEDILQDVWFHLSNLVDIEQVEQLSAWLFRAARNRIIDKHRKHTPDVLANLLDDSDDEYGTLEDVLFVEPSTPETELVRRSFWRALFSALDELPEAQKEVFIWNELEGQTFQEISDRTGENIKTLISRKRYAVKRLRERMKLLREEFEAE
jgi:RNA polymerase sigma factor (sigma-70 family)